MNFKKFLSNTINSIIMALMLTVITQLLTENKLNFNKFPMEFALGFAIGFLVVCIIPGPKIALLAAKKLRIRENSILFRAIISLITAVCYVTVIGNTISIIGRTLIGKQPLFDTLKWVASSIWIYYIAAFVFGFFFEKHIDNFSEYLSKKIKG